MSEGKGQHGSLAFAQIPGNDLLCWGTLDNGEHPGCNSLARWVSVRPCTNLLNHSLGHDGPNGDLPQQVVITYASQADDR